MSMADLWLSCVSGHLVPQVPSSPAMHGCASQPPPNSALSAFEHSKADHGRARMTYDMRSAAITGTRGVLANWRPSQLGWCAPSQQWLQRSQPTQAPCQQNSESSVQLSCAVHLVSCVLSHVSWHAQQRSLASPGLLHASIALHRWSVLSQQVMSS